MAEFNDNHKRVLGNTFRHVDTRLADLEQEMEAGDSKSAFQEYTVDISLAQRRMIIRYNAVIRDAMLKFLKDQGIPVKSENTSLQRVAKTAIQFLHITFEELRPKYLRGYGALPEDAARELNEFATRIQKLLDQMMEELQRK